MTSSISDGVIGGLVCEWTIGWDLQIVQIVCTAVYIAKLRTALLLNQPTTGESILDRCNIHLSTNSKSNMK